jgi:uncharacterized protein (DUF934 family)
MQKLTKTGVATADATVLLAKDQPLDLQSLTGTAFLHISQFLTKAKALTDIPEIGVWLDADDDAMELKQFHKKLKILAINFPTFMDGRGFSQARILKSVIGFQGELIAVGSFMQDQLFYLKRCGFDGFLVPDDASIESMCASLHDFTNTYQASTDDPRPIYRKRAFAIDSF